MTQTQHFDSDVQAIEPEGRVDFKFEGKSFIAQKDSTASRLAMVDAGYEEGFDFTMEVRCSQFTAPLRPPANTEVIEIADVEYRIVAASTDQYGIVNHYAVKQST